MRLLLSPFSQHSAILWKCIRKRTRELTLWWDFTAESCALIKASLQTVQCLLFRINFFLNLIFELKRRIVGCPIWNFSSFRNYFVQRYFRRCLSLSLKNRLAQLTVSTILLFPLSATKTCQNTKGSQKNSYISKMTKKVDGTVVTFLYQPNTI